MPSPISSLVQRIAARLRYPQLFFAALVLFLVDLVIPDMIPFVDEILFGVLTVILGSLRPEESTPGDAEPGAGADRAGRREEKDVTPRE